MASTYKVAIATASVNRLDKKELSLDQLVDIPPEMMVVGEPALAETSVHPGLQFSVGNPIEGMITKSGMTATDTLIGLAGRAAAVTGRLPRSLAFVRRLLRLA